MGLGLQCAPAIARYAPGRSSRLECQNIRSYTKWILDTSPTIPPRAIPPRGPSDARFALAPPEELVISSVKERFLRTGGRAVPDRAGPSFEPVRRSPLKHRQGHGASPVMAP